MSIYIKSGNITDMQGPCPTGYHVPTGDEAQALIDAGITLGAWTASNGDNTKTYLKMAYSGNLYTTTGQPINSGSNASFWCCDLGTNYKNFGISSTYFKVKENVDVIGFHIRPFKDTSVSPDSSWTELYTNGIYHNSTLGLISVKNGNDWITIADKNLGATTVWNNGDTMSESNCGKFYQQGNNYGFPFTGATTTSSTAVNAGSYGPSNYYSSSTWITTNPRDSSANKNLRGGETGPVSMKEVQNIYIGEYKPITEIGIYWSEADGVISFQTSAGDGISIADKNLGATQVYNSGDNLSLANMGKGYQWGNNYGWDYGVNPVNTTTTQVNAGSYGPGNYYSSSSFVIAYNELVSWDSSNNANLWGGTTNTYEARRGPCAEGWHIPSKDDAQTLVNAISSITGSVNVSKINQYCKLPSVTPGIGRTIAQWTNEPRGGIRYSDAYSGESGGMLYLPTSGSYVVNENSRKSEALPLRPFSNTFIQPTTSRTKLN